MIDSMSSIIFATTGQKLAIVMPKIEFVSKTVFLTDDADLLQVGIIKTDKARGIPKHRHLNFERNLDQTTEFLLVRSGACEVLIWENKESDPHRVVLEPGDSILLLNGIHALESLTEDLELLEVKQGPYAGVLDKELID